jgi:RHS repeat-associated protein
MNRLQDCFDDDFGNGTGAGPLFQGGRFDPEQAKLLGFQHRAFHSKAQPWNDQDSAGYVDGLNAYTAPVDEPIRAVDPLGT